MNFSHSRVSGRQIHFIPENLKKRSGSELVFVFCETAKKLRLQHYTFIDHRLCMIEKVKLLIIKFTFNHCQKQ